MYTAGAAFSGPHHTVDTRHTRTETISRVHKLETVFFGTQSIFQKGYMNMKENRFCSDGRRLRRRGASRKLVGNEIGTEMHTRASAGVTQKH